MVSSPFSGRKQIQGLSLLKVIQLACVELVPTSLWLHSVQSVRGPTVIPARGYLLCHLLCGWYGWYGASFEWSEVSHAGEEVG